MDGVEVLLLALGAVAVMGFGHRAPVPPSVLMLVGAAAVSFLPGVTRVQLAPEVILGVVMPPLLYSAATNASFFSFMRHLRPIVWLGVVLVGLTTVVVGVLANQLFPALGLAGAMALGAVVSPSDTVTAIAHGKEMGLSRRVLAILTGESLVNDAAALALFSVALVATGARTAFITSAPLLFVWVVIVGVVVGMVLGMIANGLRASVGQPTIATAFGVLLPFAAYLAAEHLHGSGVLAVVMAAFVVSMHTSFTRGDEDMIRRGHPARPEDARSATKPTAAFSSSSRDLDHTTRSHERHLWPVLDTLLEAVVVVYTGLQLRFVIDDMRIADVPLLATTLRALLVLAVVIVVRVVLVVAVFRRSRQERSRPAPTSMLLTRPESTVVAWTGMRGIVSLGAVSGIPLLLENGAPFPGRETIQFVTFVVAIGTMLIQGSTLHWLVHRLHLDTTDEQEQAEKTITTAIDLARAAADDDGRSDDVDLAAACARIQASYKRQRVALSFAARDRIIDDEAARYVLAQLDREQAADEGAATVRFMRRATAAEATATMAVGDAPATAAVGDAPATAAVGDAPSTAAISDVSPASASPASASAVAASTPPAAAATSAPTAEEPAARAAESSTTKTSAP